MDAALIKECADPALKPAIVEQFITTVGAPDPLTVTVKSGSRTILVPKATTVDQAMAVVRQYAGQAVVRVGLTQFPAGVGEKDISDLKPDLLDACENLRQGTSMFAKVLRIVAKWYGNPKSDDVFPHIFEDAAHAWKTGEFEGVDVFRAEEPGDVESSAPPVNQEEKTQRSMMRESATGSNHSDNGNTIGAAEMRINLKSIGGN